MAMFSYRAADAAGNVVQGTLEAREERQVVAHLQQGGLVPLRISLAEAATRWQTSCRCGGAGFPPGKWW